MKPKHLKLIMELIFIFIIPLILIAGTSTIDKTYVYDNDGNFETSETELTFDNSIIKYTKTETTEINTFQNILFNTQEIELSGYWYFPINNITTTYYYAEDEDGKFTFNIIVYEENGQQHNTDLRIMNEDNDTTIWISPITTETINNNNYYKYDLTNQDITINLITFSNVLTNIGYWNYETTTETITTNTIWGNIKELLITNLELNDSMLLDLIICYTILWFLMFILWHFFYLVFDGLVHLFIDWKKRSD